MTLWQMITYKSNLSNLQSGLSIVARITGCAAVCWETQQAGSLRSLGTARFHKCHQSEALQHGGVVLQRCLLVPLSLWLFLLPLSLFLYHPPYKPGIKFGIIMGLLNRAQSLIGWFVVKDSLVPRRSPLQTSYQKRLLILIPIPVGSNQPDQWNLRRTHLQDTADLRLSTYSPPTRCFAGRNIGE